MAENRSKTPVPTTIKNDVYDEAVDADLSEDYEDPLDVTRHGSLADSKLTLDSVRPSQLRAAGAAGALAGAHTLFDDNVTLESVPPGPYKYDTPGLDDPEFQRRFSVNLGLRPSEDSFERADLYNGQTGIAPPDFRLDSGELDDEGEETSPEESAEDGISGLSYYDPTQYAALPTTPLVKDLFPMIMDYQPNRIKMELKLLPFVPEMTAVIGDIDAFVKIPRPDKKQDPLGLVVLDEPSCVLTSDPQLLDLQLKALAKGATGSTLMDVKTLPDADDGEAINDWMDNVDAIHKEKPPARVYYSNVMPDMDQLMQAWPPEMEKHLDKHPPKLPANSTLAEAVDIACNILDIPVHTEPGGNGRIQALHQMMSLYLEFKRSQHFKISDD